MPSLHVNSINIKRSFLNKLSIKYCTCPHVLMFFCPLLLFISLILLLLSRDIETNQVPDPGYLKCARCTTGFNTRTIIFPYIYINNLTDNLSSNVKLSADDTSLFSDICDPLETANVLNNDLRKIREWAER